MALDFESRTDLIQINCYLCNRTGKNPKKRKQPCPDCKGACVVTVCPDCKEKCSCEKSKYL